MRTMAYAAGALVLGLSGCSRGSIRVGGVGGGCEGPECTDEQDAQDIRDSVRRDDIDATAIAPDNTAPPPPPPPPPRSNGPPFVPPPTTMPPVFVGPLNCTPGSDDCVVQTPRECGQTVFDSEPLPSDGPDLLVVFDRSARMGEPWGSAPRWQVARDGLLEAVEPLIDDFNRSGTVFLPTTGLVSSDEDAGIDDGCGVASAAGSADYLITTLEAEDAVSNYRSTPTATKPLLDGLLALDGLISENTTTAVLIMATGGPACGWDDDRAADMVSDWRLRGARTHVLALPGVSAEGSRRLDQVAAAGGVGLGPVIATPFSLTNAVTNILQDTLRRAGTSCLFELDERVEDPEAFRVAFRVSPAGELELPRDLWSLEADNTRVRLEGFLCGELLATAPSNLELRFEYACPEP